MEKFNVPDKLYYPIHEVTEKLGVTVRDLYHFEAVCALELCVYIKHHRYDENHSLRGTYKILHGNFSEAQFDDVDIIIYSVKDETIDIDGDIGKIDFGDAPLVVDSKFLYIERDSLHKFHQLSIDYFKNTQSGEHPRTANRKGEVIPALLKMIPEFDDVDLEGESISKIASILEAIAAAKGIELNLPDKNTWARYLGRK